MDLGKTVKEGFEIGAFHMESILVPKPQTQTWRLQKGGTKKSASFRHVFFDVIFEHVSLTMICSKTHFL